MDKYKLKNNIIVKSQKAEGADSITIIMKLRGGVAWENRAQCGITHLVEHLCFRRSAGIPQRELYYKIESNGGYMRGTTYRDCVIFEITVPKAGFNDAISHLAGMHLDNGWTHEDIRREKEVVYREIENAGRWTHKRVMYDFFGKSQQGEDILGTKNKVSRITRPQVVEWKKKLFENPEIIICGDFSESDLKAAYDAFSAYPLCKENPPAMIAPEGFANRNADYDRYYTDECTYIKIGFSFDLTTDISVAELLKKALFDLDISPFNMSLREESGLVYDYDAYISQFDFGGVLILIFEVHRDSAATFMRRFSEILAYQRGKLEEDAFNCAKILSAVRGRKDLRRDAPIQMLSTKL